MKKKNLLFALAIVLLMSSCTRYVIEGSSRTSCGTWYPKKFKAK